MRYLAVIISFIVSVSCAYEKYPEADEKVNAENRKTFEKNVKLYV